MRNFWVGQCPQGPVYRVVQNIHDNNDNIGASLVFCHILIVSRISSYFYFLFHFQKSCTTREIYEQLMIFFIF
ncbi:hypothetical protein PFDG_04950 [Plasmodium falciparum Dd2]|uniref:Uncharacterized protein n=1 Tax=Plasmodium falciparum (isolate Dd2) TaxID=57267 RepID=A0A0L7M9A8_PLAF4|nr:hypothetical protein PFDG_04950 [Plasmodium falciparum Dd2]